MPRSRHAVLLCLALVTAACATDPASRCAPRESRELRVIDGLIARTRAEIAQGYRRVETPGGAAVNLCLGSAGSRGRIGLCTTAAGRSRAEPIDPAAAARTLDALLARREELAARIAAAVATCPAP